MDNPENPTPLQRQNMTLPQLRMQRAIFIKTVRGDSFFIDANPSDNIGDIKDKIKEKKGIAKGDQHLVYQGKNLNNNAPINNIKDGDSPVLVVKGASASNNKSREISNNEKKYGLRPTRLPTPRPSMNSLLIKTMDGDSFFIDAKPSNTISDLKDRIKERKNIAKEKQFLIYQGKRMNNDRTVLDYNIRSGDPLMMVVRAASASNPEPREISNNEKKYGLRPTRLPTRRTIVNKRRSTRRSRRV
jgi:ubiquitin C